MPQGVIEYRNSGVGQLFDGIGCPFAVVKVQHVDPILAGKTFNEFKHANLGAFSGV
jgi:hypothetical protein